MNPSSHGAAAKHILDDLTPVRRLSQPWKRAAPVVALGAFMAAAVYLRLGVRHDAPLLGRSVLWGLSALQMGYGVLLVASALRTASVRAAPSIRTATNPRILARPGRVAPVLADVLDHPAVIEEAVSLLNKVYGRDRVGLQASFYMELKNKEKFVVEGTYTLAEADVAAILCNKPDRRATSLADLEHFDFFFIIDEAGDKTTQTAFVRTRPPDIPVRVLRDPVDGQRFHLYLGNRPIGLEVVDRLYEEGFERMYWNGDPIKKGYIADHPPRPPLTSRRGAYDRRENERREEGRGPCSRGL
jgi:hypothetical protein